MRTPRRTMAATIANAFKTAFPIELLIAKEGRAVNTQHRCQILALGQTLRHQHSADITLGRRIIARATHQRTGGIHEDEFFGRLDDRQPRTQCDGFFRKQGEFNGAWHTGKRVSY